MMTAAELSKILNVTPANIRHHLSILLRQGSVKLEDHGQYFKRGRPAAIYALSQPGQKDNLDILIQVLFEVVYAQSRIESRESILQWIAQSLISDYPPDTSNPTKRLYSTIRILNQLNYRAQWEARENPHITFTHCPYMRILDKHPELCQIDSCIIEKLSGGHVQQIEKLAFTAANQRYCLFQITKK